VSFSSDFFLAILVASKNWHLLLQQSITLSKLEQVEAEMQRGSRVFRQRDAAAGDEPHHSRQGVVTAIIKTKKKNEDAMHVMWDAGGGVAEGPIPAADLRGVSDSWTPLRIFLTAPLLLLWWLWSTPQHKLAGFAIATGFAAIEFFWYGVSQWDAEGRVVVDVGKFALSRCHTTKKMFVSLLVASPVLIEAVQALVALHPLLCVLAFPLKIWLLEVAIGYFLLFVWNCRAWIYIGRDAMFSGTIKLGYALHWTLLGAVVVNLFM
jgi:hypothetical protein